MNVFKRMVPWWAKIPAKIALSRLPIPYRIWKSFGLFEHGRMDRSNVAWTTFLEHARTAGVLQETPQGVVSLRRPQVDAPVVVCEIGPGDSLFTAWIASSLGASRTWLVDAGAYAVLEAPEYRRFANWLEAQGYALRAAPPEGDVHGALEALGARYLTRGTASLREIPSAEVTFMFSNAVLEHVPRDEFPQLAQEMRRVLASEAVAVHRVDLKDHLGGALNNLRFSRAVWEGRVFRSSGFYTNRIRMGEMLAQFRKAGLAVEVARKTQWPRLPLPRSAMAAEFRNLPDEDLLVSGFDCVLRPER